MGDKAGAKNRALDQIPDWYKDCFRNALRRVSILLNCAGSYTTCSRSIKLDCSEEELARTFQKHKWDKELIHFSVAAPDDYANTDEYSAEYFFYSDIDFPLRGDQRISKFTVPQPFLEWSFRRLHQPSGNDDTLNLSEFSDGMNDPEFIRHCAANYLVKNFWHNFVHRVVQGIATANYHEFSGPAREDSDFEADHLANLLLVRAFGIRLYARGKPPPDTQLRTEVLFRRNRCNLVFSERAQHRAMDRSKMSREERWAELEWRFCRSVSNVVSMTLISHGLTTPSIRVFLSGYAKSSMKKGMERNWRVGKVIVEVAGRRIATPLPAYVPDDELRAEVSNKKVDEKRQSQIRSFRQKREQEIATYVLSTYRGIIHDDQLFREGVVASLKALGTRLSIPLI